MTYPLHQPRRLRKTKALRNLVQETRLSPAEFIYPLFLVPGKNQVEEIASMPGQYRYSADALAPILEKMHERRVNAVLLFGQTDTKDAHGHAAYADHNIVIEAIKNIKKINPELTIITDVCLCGYTDHGHCGPLKTLLHQRKVVDNEKTLEIIAEMAVAHAQAGADIVAPSGMIDGMVGMIRERLDHKGFSEVAILSYAVKYASSFYGPFREAVASSPRDGDRRGHQMNPANRKEALLEAALDVEEGADLLMVKPGLPYLDIISDLSQNFDIPVLAYQVSGEYSMIKAAAQKGWIDEQSSVLESLLSMKRAGARAIITYFALSVDLP